MAPLPPPAGIDTSPTRGPLLLALALVVALVVVGGVIIAYLVVNQRPPSTARGAPISAAPGTDPGNGDTAAGGHGQTVDGIACDTLEEVHTHVHAHLYILRDGLAQPVSAYVGIPGAPTLNRCYYWLHTHDRSGIIHIESPNDRKYTLGDFFDIWGQPLSRGEVARMPVGSRGLAVFVDGRTYNGDPRQVQLGAHTQVVIEIGRRVPPPTYKLNGF